MTALQDACVCMSACGHILNVHKYFPKIERPRRAMLGYGQSAVSATIAEVAQVEARTGAYFLFVTAATDRQSTAGCSQPV